MQGILGNIIFPYVQLKIRVSVTMEEGTLAIGRQQAICHNEPKIDHRDMSSMCCSQTLGLRTSANPQQSIHWAVEL